MSDIAIQIDNLSKVYKKGTISSRTFNDDVKRFFARLKAQPDPLSKVDEERFGIQQNGYLWALKNINLKVKQGTVLGIVGKNGVGKSTLLKIISKITAPTEGEVKIKGRVASLLEVGTGFHPDLTGRENLYLNGAILGMSKAEIDTKLDEIIEFSGVREFIETPVKRYSSGMRVRLAFAIAAHLEPEILLVDEVLAVGDVSFQKKCLGKIGDIVKQGRTVLIVSHNLGLIRDLCDECILLHEGQIVEQGVTADVVSKYLALTTIQGSNKSAKFWPNQNDAPGSDEMRLNSIQISDENLSMPDSYDSGLAIQIEIDFNVLTELRGMRFVIRFITCDGHVAFASTDHNIRDNELKTGNYKSVCTIPPNLLNQGEYLVRVSADIPGVKVIIIDNELLSFTVFNSGTHGSHFPENWPGIVAPRLQWETKSVD